MNFCDKCDNMFYLKIGETSDKLIHYCRNCGNETDNLTAENICVSRTTIRNNKGYHLNIINDFTKEDPTLPRTDTIKCPNQECLTNTEPDTNKREVLYIRYDDTNLKYVYMCTSCNMTWKTNEAT